MESYRKEMQKIIIAAILLAVLIASSILVAAYFSGQIDDISDDFGDNEFTTLLPTAPLTLIVDSGAQGTQVVGNLEFGFRNSSSGIMIGVVQEWLDIHNGFNKTDVIGFGAQELREYSFMYLDDEIAFDDWTNRTPSSVTSTDDIAWGPDSRSGMFSGDIAHEELSQISMAGYIIEFAFLSVMFKDGSLATCGPANLSLGVNFTKTNSDWHVDYILEASNSENIVFSSDSVTVTLDYVIPDSDDDTIEQARDAFIVDTYQVVVGVATIPAVIGIVLVGCIILLTRRR